MWHAKSITHGQVEYKSGETNMATWSFPIANLKIRLRLLPAIWCSSHHVYIWPTVLFEIEMNDVKIEFVYKSRVTYTVFFGWYSLL